MDVARSSQKLFTSLHTAVFRCTGGRIGGRFGSVENVLLTTTGRKSGRSRTIPLTATIDGDRVVLVASNGGSATHPDWYLNLVVDPAVTVQRGTDVMAMEARTAGADEHRQLWEKVTATYSVYDRYQARTERRIPIVVCEPVDS